MRVPDELAKAKALELGVEFKCKALGDFVTTSPVSTLPLAKPPIQSFFQGMNEESMKTNPKAVLEAFEKAFEHYPDEPQLQMGYAYVMLQIEDPKVRDLKKAIAAAKKAAAENGPIKGYALMILAKAYHKDGQVKLAVDTIKLAAPLCGANPEFSQTRDEIMKDAEKAK